MYVYNRGVIIECMYNIKYTRNIRVIGKLLK